METLTDYILWRGDLKFTQSRFNIMDAMVLSQVTYFDMLPYFSAAHPSGNADPEDKSKDGALPANGGAHVIGTISEIYEYLSSHDAIKCTIVGPSEKSIRLFKAAAMSERFGNVKISFHADIHAPEYSLQFAAMTFTVKDEAGELAYVSYRGTDGSVAGWKEDFMMTCRRTRSQAMALDYLQHVILKYSARHGLSADKAPDTASKLPELSGPGAPYPRFIVGGHSKGANHAMFASALLPAELQDRLETIYIFDGPGFCPDVLDAELLQPISGRMKRVVPEYCIFGKIFEVDVPDTVIVKSTDLGIMQHNMSTWRLDHNHLLTADGYYATSRLLSAKLMNWVNTMNLEEREEFVQRFFRIFEESLPENWDMNEAGERLSERIGEKIGGRLADRVPGRLTEKLPDNLAGKLIEIEKEIRRLL
ncbi:MAG: DUF2974 domain-containing protein [Eubacteriales bacterium]|nr:DUF2974 domain-containing protein [Eubacteriales bacterium]